jgi:hypothetical protein
MSAAPARSIALYAAAALSLGVAAAPALAVSDMTSGIYATALPDGTLNRIQELLPETKTLNPAFVNSSIDPNIKLLKDASISITFIDEGAGYKNSFGYFLYDREIEDNGKVEIEIESMKTIFANASEVGGGGSLKPGDTIDLGKFEAGTNIGFWLKADGYNSKSGYTYYTIDSLNPDGYRHVAMIADVMSSRLVLGVEDLYNLGDKDYNDIVFTFTATPFSAIDIKGMPTGAPEAGPLATAAIMASLFGAFLRKRRQDPSDDAADRSGA